MSGTAAKTRQGSRSPGWYDLICAVILLALAATPLACTIANARHEAVAAAAWVRALLWLVLVAGAFAYARRRCGSPQRPYWSGLLWAAAAANTGWSGMSFLLAIPAVLAMFLASLTVALRNDIARRPRQSPQEYERLIRWFYSRRLRP